MALTLLLFNFAKKQNSTATPADSSGVAVDVVLKNETSLNAPVFLLSGARPNYTYAKFDGAYYFIDDIRSVRNNLYELVCTLDPLATYKADILASSAFVEYATQGNNQITDPRLGVEYGVAGVNVEVAGSAIPYMDVDINDSGFFISVVGQTTTDTYYISAAALEQLFSRTVTWVDDIIDESTIDTSSVESAIGSTMELLLNGFKQLIASGNAADCVRDAYCLPIVAPTSVLSSASQLYLGMFDSRIAANKIIGAGNVERTVTVTIPHQYSDWRKQAPYEVCQLFLPLYGTINIPSDIAADSSSLTVRGILNVRSGDYTYYISGTGRNANEIVVGGNCAAPLAVGASNINMMQAVSAGLGMGVNAAYGNIVGAAASLMSIAPAPHSVGQTGGISNRSARIQCIVYYRNTSDTPGASSGVNGIPIQATRQLSVLSGYVQTKGASVSGSIRGVNRDMINSMLDSGIFIE